MKNHQSKTRRCAHCGQRFIINPRVGRRHRYCSSVECCRVSRATARKKWLKKNGGNAYFRDPITRDRVRAWRRKNPNYWKKRNRFYPERKGFKLTKKFAAVLRYVALQDSIDANLALKIGLISRITGCALQDAIANEVRKIILRGHAILRQSLHKNQRKARAIRPITPA